MTTFTKLDSGSWRVQVRRKRQYVANTFYGGMTLKNGPVKWSGRSIAGSRLDGLVPTNHRGSFPT